MLYCIIPDVLLLILPSMQTIQTIHEHQLFGRIVFLYVLILYHWTW